MLSIISFIFQGIIYLLLYAYAFITMLIDLMSRPFQCLLGKIKTFLGKRFHISDDLNGKFRVVNGFAPFILLMSALVFTTVAFVISSLNWNKQDNYLTYMLFNTTIGSVAGFIAYGFEFTPATMVAIAFSGMLLPMCMNAHKPENKEAPIYIRIPCYVVYLFASSILAMTLTPVFQAVGDWGYQTILALFNGLGESIILAILKIIVLIPLCYVALLLCLITIKTYAECVVFGIIGLIAAAIISAIVSFLGGMLLDLIPETYSAIISEVISTVFAIGVFFGLDILQSKFVGAIEESINEKDEKNKNKNNKNKSNKKYQKYKKDKANKLKEENKQDEEINKVEEENVLAN